MCLPCCVPETLPTCSAFARFFAVVTFRAGLGADFFRRLQRRAAKRAEEKRVIDEPRLFLFEIDEANRHVDDAVGADRNQGFEIAAFESFFQLLAAGSELRRGFRHSSFLLTARDE